MIDIMKKYKKGTIVQIGTAEARVTSDLMKFKDFYAIYADAIDGLNNDILCCTCKIHDRVSLVIRDKKRMLDARIKC